MTPFNVTDLWNKDSGDAAGDLAFSVDEMAMPMYCRSAPPLHPCPLCYRVSRLCRRGPRHLGD